MKKDEDPDLQRLSVILVISALIDCGYFVALCSFTGFLKYWQSWDLSYYLPLAGLIVKPVLAQSLQRTARWAWYATILILLGIVFAYSGFLIDIARTTSHSTEMFSGHAILKLALFFTSPELINSLVVLILSYRILFERTVRNQFFPNWW